MLERTPLRDLIQILPYGQHSSFPVTDSAGNLVGMLSLQDFRKVVFQDALLDLVIARDIATIPAIAVTTGDNLDEALRLIEENGFTRLPVVKSEDKSGKVVGILSQGDILSAYGQALKARGLRERLTQAKE